MIKATYFEDDKKTVCGSEYFEDEELDELYEAVEDYGEEYVSIEFDSRDFVGYERDRYITEILKEVCVWSVESEEMGLEKEMKDMTPHKFSEKFEKNMEALINDLRNKRF